MGAVEAQIDRKVTKMATHIFLTSEAGLVLANKIKANQSSITTLRTAVDSLETRKADKTEIPSPYDDTAIVGRIEALENNPAPGDFEYVSATEAESWFN